MVSRKEMHQVLHFSQLCSGFNRTTTGNKWKIKAFTDDTILFIEGEDWNDIEIKANLGMSNIQNWYSKNNLSLKM